MICCTLIALVIGSTLFLMRLVNPMASARQINPLAWRPGKKAMLMPVDAGKKFSWKARLQSFQYAKDGLKFLVRHEDNAKLHMIATTIVLAIGILLNISREDWRWLVLAIVLVWIAEALNTSLEQLCNVVSPEQNETIRIVKDVAAGAVLASAFGAVILGMVTLLPYVAAEIFPEELWLDICKSSKTG